MNERLEKMGTELILIIAIVLFIIYFVLRRNANKQANEQMREQERNYKPLEEVAPEVRRRLQSGEGKIPLIKYVREVSGLGLKEAKDFVEQQEHPERNTDNPDSDIHSRIQDMLQSGEGVIKVIKQVREETGLGLKEAKDLVEEVKNGRRG